MKKILCLFLLGCFLYVNQSNAALIDKLFGVSYTKKDMKTDIKDVKTELGVIKDVQIKLNNQLDLVMNTMVNMEANINNDLRASLAAMASANAEIKGMIGSVDASLKQNQQVGSGTLTNITTDPKMVMTIFIAQSIVIVVLIVGLIILLSIALKSSKKVKESEIRVRETETKAKDFKRGYYDLQNKLDKLTMALSRDPKITLDLGKDNG